MIADIRCSGRMCVILAVGIPQFLAQPPESFHFREVRFHIEHATPSGRR